jgi:hypothetical protein
MNRFVIVDGLPYLTDGKKFFAVRWDEKGFTVGAKVKLRSVPETTYSELEILAQCAGKLDSIGGNEPEAGQEEDKKKADDAP